MLKMIMLTVYVEVCDVCCKIFKYFRAFSPWVKFLLMLMLSARCKMYAIKQNKPMSENILIDFQNILITTIILYTEKRRRGC